MKEKIEKNNNIEVKNEKQQGEVLEKSEPVKNVIGEMVGTSEPEPETIADEISKYPDTVASPEQKKELIKATEKADKIMKSTEEGAPIFKTAKGKKRRGMEEKLQTSMENSNRENTERTEGYSVPTNENENIR